MKKNIILLLSIALFGCGGDSGGGNTNIPSNPGIPDIPDIPDMPDAPDLLPEGGELISARRAVYYVVDGKYTRLASGYANLNTEIIDKYNEIGIREIISGNSQDVVVFNDHTYKVVENKSEQTTRYGNSKVPIVNIYSGNDFYPEVKVNGTPAVFLERSDGSVIVINHTNQIKDELLEGFDGSIPVSSIYSGHSQTLLIREDGLAGNYYFNELSNSHGYSTFNSKVNEDKMFYSIGQLLTINDDGYLSNIYGSKLTFVNTIFDSGIKVKSMTATYDSYIVEDISGERLIRSSSIYADIPSSWVFDDFDRTVSSHCGSIYIDVNSEVYSNGCLKVDEYAASQMQGLGVRDIFVSNHDGTYYNKDSGNAYIILDNGELISIGNGDLLQPPEFLNWLSSDIEKVIANNKKVAVLRGDGQVLFWTESIFSNAKIVEKNGQPIVAKDIEGVWNSYFTDFVAIEEAVNKPHEF
ncbi:hypothetical protein BCS96_18345 [Vibrio breoganii]|uniref:hypothetical protein n=1 Tax=Vibrio breoganii TaxID=553239 RepID=UPI000C821C65|nr:hypothetical protein [Vibrio breoganii]PML40638.1 hypothetical protein BCT78_18530 [Vibrio breoganii]PML89699.1 hypothetical protein BCT68_18335 [Vibrio breoganii]PMP03806.1 hypothetical protein BCS96_18345 [Vibrio breoganii]